MDAVGVMSDWMIFALLVCMAASGSARRFQSGEMIVS